MPIFEGQPQTIIYNPTTGIITDANGNVISGVASYTWAQFTAGDFDTSIARYVHVSDRHSTTDGTSTPGSLWWIDPTATAIRKRNLVSGPIYYSSHLSAVTELPMASWPTMRIRCADVGNGRFPLNCNGTRYIPEGRVVLLKNVYGTKANPTKTEAAGSTAWTYNIDSPQFPANLFASPDSLNLKLRLQRHGATATMVVRANLGTAGDGTDAALWVNTLSATDLLISPAEVYIDISDSTHMMTNQNNGQSGPGAVNYVLDITTNFNTASILKFSITGTKNTSDSVDLLSYSLEWSAV